MPQDVTLYSARRSYEFAVDDIRLTILTALQSLVHQTFSFQIAQIGTPTPTFGEVPITAPPGIVFGNGSFVGPEGSYIPIRFMHIEPRRIVIDVAAKTQAIDAVFERLREIFAGIRAPDGASVLGEPTSVRDSSEIGVRLPTSPIALIPEPIRSIVHRVLQQTSGSSDVILVPMLRVIGQSPANEYGAHIAPYPAFQIEPRGGSEVGVNHYFSLAPLSSDEHIAVFQRLAEKLAAEPDQS
jgi:hypothetical protein